MPSANRAVFLDRDGVLNEMMLNPANGIYEAPHQVSDLQMITKALEGALLLQNRGFELFVVSNQPDHAKGKTSMENIKAIAAQVSLELASHGIQIREFYYCYHHPQGIVPEYTLVCDCRKPGSQFLFKAADEYSIDLKRSWMVGDRDIDVQCGQNAGCKTILILNEHSKANQGRSRPDFSAATLLEAARFILKTEA